MDEQDLEQIAESHNTIPTYISAYQQSKDERQKQKYTSRAIDLTTKNPTITNSGMMYLFLSDTNQLHKAKPFLDEFKAHHLLSANFHIFVWKMASQFLKPKITQEKEN